MKFNKKVLKNGLRIITVPMKNNQTVTVMVMVEAGSKYETKDINGISHFLEHMCFKGTTKRPTSAVITEELDSMGSQYNAFTGTEYTGYYAKAHYSHLPKVLDIVSDIYLNSTLPSEEIQKERGVIIEEINMYEDLPQRKVAEVFEELLYGDQPAGWSIAGSKEVIQKVQREDFVEYRKKHYVSKATTIVVAGKINEKKIIKDIEKIFADISTSKKHDKKNVVEKQSDPQVKIHFKKTDQTHLILGFRSFDMYDKRKTAIGLLATVLGQGMSSRLFKKMRDDLGICYYVRASNDTSTDHGVFSVSAGVSNERVEEAIKAILEEVEKLKTEKVSKEELQKVKDFIIGNMFLSLEGSDDFTDFYGFQEIFKKKIKTPEEIVAEIKKVTADQILNISKEIFQNNKLNLALIGPFEDKDRFVHLLSL